MIVILDLACAALVYARVPTYINWYLDRKKDRLPLVLLEGLVAGLGVALIVLLYPGRGEPSVTPRAVDTIIWFAVLGIVGMASAVAVYYANVMAIVAGKRWG